MLWKPSNLACDMVNMSTLVSSNWTHKLYFPSWHYQLGCGLDLASPPRQVFKLLLTQFDNIPLKTVITRAWNKAGPWTNGLQNYMQGLKINICQAHRAHRFSFKWQQRTFQSVWHKLHSEIKSALRVEWSLNLIGGHNHMLCYFSHCILHSCKSIIF